jgi:putative colanic acid biosynthesis acetyltransferase WcaF
MTLNSGTTASSMASPPAAPATEPVSVDPPGTPQMRLQDTEANPYSLREYLGRYTWYLVERTLFRISTPRAYRWRAFLLRRFGAKIAKSCGIRRTVRVWHPWLLSIGEHSVIGDHVTIYNLSHCTIGRQTTISQNVHLCGGTHDHRSPTMPLIRSRIQVGDHVWIAADAFIGPDVTVNNGVVVGARAVVMRDMPAWQVCVGHPAKPIASRNLRSE